jgi:hypothetical protein
MVAAKKDAITVNVAKTLARPRKGVRWNQAGTAVLAESKESKQPAQAEPISASARWEIIVRGLMNV